MQELQNPLNRTLRERAFQCHRLYARPADALVVRDIGKCHERELRRRRQRHTPCPGHCSNAHAVCPMRRRCWLVQEPEISENSGFSPAPGSVGPLRSLLHAGRVAFGSTTAARRSERTAAPRMLLGPSTWRGMCGEHAIDSIAQMHRNMLRRGQVADKCGPQGSP